MGIGWLSSLTVHALILGGALWIVDEIQPVPPKVFRWDVAMVEMIPPQNLDAAAETGSTSTARATSRPTRANRSLVSIERKVVPRGAPRRRFDATTTLQAVRLSKPPSVLKRTIRKAVGGATSRFTTTTAPMVPGKTAARSRSGREPLLKKIDRIESTQRVVKGRLQNPRVPTFLPKRAPMVGPVPTATQMSVRRVPQKLTARMHDAGFPPSASAEAAVVTKRVPTSERGMPERTGARALASPGTLLHGSRAAATSSQAVKSTDTALRPRNDIGLVPTRVGVGPSSITSSSPAEETTRRVTLDPDAPQILARLETDSTIRPLRSGISQGQDARASRSVMQLATEGKELNRTTSRGSESTGMPSSAGKLTARNGSSVGTDYGWLARAMLERVTAFRSYPSAARANNWEGKVVVRAVISENGDLADVSIKQSSGHQTLDQDAMNLVRRVCPLPLEFPLGRPQVVMQIPITYSLR